MTPRNRPGFQQLIDDLHAAGVSIVDLTLLQLGAALKAMDEFQLDFDDAFDYAVAEKLDLTIVSFDADFDGTPRPGRMTAEQAVVALRKSS